MTWLSPPFDRAVFARALGKPFAAAAPLPSLVLPSALDPAQARKLRLLAQPRLRKFALADQGTFHESRGAPHRGLLEELLAFAEGVTGRALRVIAARTLLFRAGDYALRLEDARRHHPAAPRWLELTHDHSSGPCEDARVVYSTGLTQHLIVPQDPGQLALVERTQATTRYERYLSAGMGRRAAWRLRVSLADRETAP